MNKLIFCSLVLVALLIGSASHVNKVFGQEASYSCAAIYAPVCGTDSKTYSNDCVAKQSGATVAYKSACATSPYICAPVHEPICGKDGLTYYNGCFAGQNGADVAYFGECRTAETRFCTADYNPVCGTDGKTYSNSCNAGLSNVGVAYTGECKAPAYACTMEYAPVCGTNSKTYSNSCVAKQNGATIAYSGECKTPLPAPVPPTPPIPTPAPLPDYSSTGTVNVDVLNVRSEPSVAGMKIGAIKRGQIFSTNLEEKNNWIRIKVTDLIPGGWVYKPFTSLYVSTPIGSMVIVTASNLNIRAGAGTTYSIVGKATYGTVLKKTGESNGWVKTPLPGGQDGWVFGAFVK